MLMIAVFSNKTLEVSKQFPFNLVFTCQVLPKYTNVSNTRYKLKDILGGHKGMEGSDRLFHAKDRE